jgi:hypothetical protein
MAVSGVNPNEQVRTVDRVGLAADQGGSFNTSAPGQASPAGRSTVDLDWGGMDLDQFKNVAEGAGMDPDSPEVEAAFHNAAGDDVLSPKEFMDNFGSAVKNKDAVLSPEAFMKNFGSAVKEDDGREITLDNAAFQDAVGKVAEGGPAAAEGAPSESSPPAEAASPAAGTPAGGPESASGASGTEDPGRCGQEPRWDHR